MEKFITTDKIADFVERMWNAGIRCELKPKESYISIWSHDYGKHEIVHVVSQRAYDELVRSVICDFLPIDNGINSASEEV
jgi:hypothetical protein